MCQQDVLKFYVRFTIDFDVCQCYDELKNIRSNLREDIGEEKNYLYEEIV